MSASIRCNVPGTHYNLPFRNLNGTKFELRMCPRNLYIYTPNVFIVTSFAFCRSAYYTNSPRMVYVVCKAAIIRVRRQGIGNTEPIVIIFASIDNPRNVCDMLRRLCGRCQYEVYG